MNNTEKNKEKNTVRKVITAVGACAAVIALCVCSSRFSWFGTHSQSSDATSHSTLSTVAGDSQDISSTAPQSSSSALEETPRQTTSVTTSLHSSVTTTPAAVTTSVPTKPQTTTPKPQTTTTTPKITTATTTTTAPVPLWTETKHNAQYYVTVDCYSRAKALIGSERVSLYKTGTLVTIVAKTDTDYFKLSDGSFIHGDYLSSTKPVVTTTKVTTTAKTTTSKKPAATSPSSTTKKPADSPSKIECQKMEYEVFTLINEIRRDYGLTPFKWDNDAYTAATIRANEITASFSHTRLDGSRFYTVFDEAGAPSYSVCAENIAAGQTDAAAVVSSWMNSEGHRNNILNPDLENLAVGYKYVENSSYKHYWVQEFCTYFE